MSDSTSSDDALPIWARPNAFPKSPGGYGWLDPKGREHKLGSEEELIQSICNDMTGVVSLIWTPRHSRMILPEALEGARDSVMEGRDKRITADRVGTRKALSWGTILGALGLLIFLAMHWHQLSSGGSPLGRFGNALLAMMDSTVVGIGLLLYLLVVLIPWYQARKRWLEWNGGSKQEVGPLIPLLKFETWLDLQKAPVTKAMAVVITLVALLQWYSGDSIATAGLVKEAYRHGQWWRLFTAPLLHGNPVHYLMNISALLYLGKRVEVFARWPHLLVVFVFSALVGGLMSVRFMEATSIGASGGLMGWLGFLLVFESLHERLVPRSARRRLLAGVALTALIGLLGYRFIDNAAHAGGLLAGIVYALIVFPKSKSSSRPSIMLRDRVAGGVAGLILLASAVMATVAMLRI